MNTTEQDRFWQIRDFFCDADKVAALLDFLSDCTGEGYFCHYIKNDNFVFSKSCVNRFTQLEQKITENGSERFRKAIYPDDMMYFDLHRQILCTKHDYNEPLEYRWQTADNEAVWVKVSADTIYSENGEAEIIIASVSEAGEKQHTDNVTGLLGEFAFENDFAVASADKKGQKGYLLRFDIDNFGEINEYLGIEAGNEILHMLADYIKNEAGEQCRVYRLTGDGVLVLSADGTAENAEKLFNNVKRRVAELGESSNYEIVFTVSAGVCPIVLGDIDFSLAMKYTEFALNQAKRSGKNRLCAFSSKEYEVNCRKMQILQELHRDVKNGCHSMTVYFQPIVNANTYEIIGAEALLRWTSEKLGSISPSVFVPILEESKLIIPVGKWVCGVSAEICKKWQSIIPGFKVNVNLSYIQIKMSDIVDDIAASIEKYDLPPNSLVIEMTESGYIDADTNFNELFGRIKDLKIQLAIDDFGTGYSNLRYLKDMHADILKIDRSFVSKSFTSEYDYLMIKNIIEMAHSVGLKICLEGVEREEELEKLRMLGPDSIQGFLFGKPVNEKEFVEKFLSK